MLTRSFLAARSIRSATVPSGREFSLNVPPQSAKSRASFPQPGISKAVVHFGSVLTQGLLVLGAAR